METLFIVLQNMCFFFLLIDTSNSDLCKSKEGWLECCPGFSWDIMEKRCKRCDAGKFGPRCEKVCPYPSYGNLCISKCDCNEDLCNPSDGCSAKKNTSTTFSQNIRLLGLSSSDAERNSFAGPDAITKETSTANSHCNDDHTYTNQKDQYHEDSQYMYFATVGIVVLAAFVCIIFVRTKENDDCCWVRSTNGTEICSKCLKGYIGNKCELPCRYPGYGKLCQQSCNCEEKNCNHITGCQNGSPTITPNSKSATEIDRSLLHEDVAAKKISCPDGFTGNNCEMPCRFPSYGYGCQPKCGCDQINCNHINGCNVSFTTCNSEGNHGTEAMLYSTVILSVWAITQIGIYLYISLIFIPGSRFTIRRT